MELPMATVRFVSKPMIQPKQPQKFDLKLFEQMIEPFSVRVEKVRGSMKQDVTPPAPTEVGWAKEHILELQTWIVTNWSGGGHYLYAIIDSSSPPLTMEWTGFYLPADFPEKIPPMLQGGALGAPIPISAHQPPKAPLMAAPLGSFYPQFTQTQQPQQSQPQGYYQMPAAQQGFVPTPSSYTADADRRRLEDALAAANTQLQQAREQVAQREFERRSAEQKSENDRRFTELQQLIQQMGQNLTVQKPANDPAIEQLREANRQLQEQMRMQVESAERTRREQELRDLIKTNQEETRRQIEAANARYETLMRETAGKGPDPTLTMFQESMRMQVEAMKDMARNSQAQLDRAQSFMMRPQDVIQLTKDSSTGVDQVAMQMNRAWQDMFNVSKQLTEQAAQLNQGGGNEVVSLVRDIGGKVGEWAEKYTGGKAKTEIAGLNAQAEIARAQADVAKSQNERLTEMARMETAMKQGTSYQRTDGVYVGPQGPVQAAIPASVPTNGNGHVMPPWVTQKKAPKAEPVVASSGLGGSSEVAIEEKPSQLQQVENHRVTNAAATAVARKVKGRTDEEWFGPMLPKVIELRGFVDKFLEGLERDPPEVLDNAAPPSVCAFAIHQAAMFVMEQQIAIPAMVDFLIQGMVPDFIDVLLPDAPQAYRDDVAKILMNGGEDEEEDDEDEDEDDKTQSQAS